MSNLYIYIYVVNFLLLSLDKTGLKEKGNRRRLRLHGLVEGLWPLGSDGMPG